MKNKTYLVENLIADSKISPIEMAKLVCSIVDSKPESDVSMTPLQFCRKIVECGLRHYRFSSPEISIGKGLEIYIKAKSDLRIDSLNDIKSLSRRLLKICPEIGERYFSEIPARECECWLNTTFKTSSQFNKGKAMLHGLFEFGRRHEWCDKNPLKLIPRRKVIEKEISPLSIKDVKKLLVTAQTPRNKDCAAAVCILLFAGIRPGEVSRLKWRDIDLIEKTITVRSQCSKTGGVRQIEICRNLQRMLLKYADIPNASVCPSDWKKRWKKIRDDSGFKDTWIQDILRHTYASFHAKYYKDLPRLQLNMGHRDLSLLRSRYINMGGISNADAKIFFMGS